MKAAKSADNNRQSCGPIWFALYAYQLRTARSHLAVAVKTWSRGQCQSAVPIAVIFLQVIKRCGVQNGILPRRERSTSSPAPALLLLDRNGGGKDGRSPSDDCPQ